MRPQLPLASYLFILRRHLWLVLGVVAAVLAAGWLYARSETPVYRSTAIVYIQSQPRSRDPIDPRLPQGGEDPVFIANQVYLVRNDRGLAERVLRHLRREETPPADGGSAAPAGGPTEPPPPGPELFRDLRPESLTGRVSVSSIPATSYYEFTVTGPDPRLNGALVNAYARVFEEVFREDRASRFQGTLRDFDNSLKDAQGRLAKANVEIADFKKQNPLVDFSGTGKGAARENADALRGALARERSTLQVLLREQKTVRETLEAVGLRFREEEKVGTVLVPACAEPADRDPRLSERVQALDVVAQNTGVQSSLAAIKAVDDEIYRLKTGAGGTAPLREESTEVGRLRTRRGELVAGLARSTEAALLKHAQSVAQSQGIVDDYGKELEKLDVSASAEGRALAELERLQKAAASVQEDVDRVTKQILDAEVQRKRFEESGGTVRVHAYARPGETALVTPNRPVIYLGTVVLALLLGAGLAYVLEYFDDTVKTREDFDRLVRLPFLGYVPHVPDDAEGGPDLVVAAGKTGAPEVEAFRALRTGIQFSRPDQEVRTFLVTSAGPGEGKTTVAINVATAFAGGKGRVLLVDADLRRARVHAALGVSNDRGLTNVLVGEAPLSEVVQASAVPGLDVLSSGPIPPNPADVLGSDRMQQVLREAAGRWERIVVDSPPIVAVTDPALLAKFVDAVFLVISIGKTSIRTIQRAQETLATVGVSIHGAILNNADERISGYGGYYGGYGYGYGYGYRSRTGEAPAKTGAAPSGAPRG